MDNEQIDEFIQLLHKNELALAALYETFATVFSTSSEDWLEYAGEERLHAKWINILHGYMKAEKISFEQTKIASQAIRTSIGYIERQKRKP